MRDEFEVTGLFYELEGHKLRKYLDIKKIGDSLKIPDLMVVMMNPGSSYPLDRIDNNTKPTAAEPDNTQDQIMKVMQNTSLCYARVLNLSDIRTSDSDVLYKFLKSDESESIDHSIFSDSRKPDLQNLFIKGVPVVFGWGVNSALVPLAKRAIDALSIDNPHGLLKPKTEYSFYHPLPRIYKKQLEWVQNVTSQIARTQHSCASV